MPNGFVKWKNLIPKKEAAKFLTKNSSEKKLLQNCPDRENPVLKEIDNSKKYKIIRPEKTLPVNWLSNDKKKIIESISLGEKATKKFFASKKIIKT